MPRFHRHLVRLLRGTALLLPLVLGTQTSVAAQAMDGETRNRAVLRLGFARAHPDHQLCDGPGFLTGGAEYQRGERVFARLAVQWYLGIEQSICDHVFPPDEQGRAVYRFTEAIPLRAQYRVGVGHRLTSGPFPLHMAAMVAAIPGPVEWRPYGAVALGLGALRSGAGVEVELGWDRIRHVTTTYAAREDGLDPYGEVLKRTTSHQWVPLISAGFRLYRSW